MIENDAPKLSLNLVSYAKSLFNKEIVTGSLHRQVLLFLGIGTICFFIDMTLLVFQVEMLKFAVVPATAVSVILTTLIAYLLNVKFIFEGGKFSLTREVMLFFIFSIIGVVLNIVLMYVLVVYILMWYVLAKVLITLAVSVFNFTTRKLFIFNK